MKQKKNTIFLNPQHKIKQGNYIYIYSRLLISMPPEHKIRRLHPSLGLCVIFRWLQGSIWSLHLLQFLFLWYHFICFSCCFFPGHLPWNAWDILLNFSFSSGQIHLFSQSGSYCLPSPHYNHNDDLQYDQLQQAAVYSPLCPSSSRPRWVFHVVEATEEQQIGTFPSTTGSKQVASDPVRKGCMRFTCKRGYPFKYGKVEIPWFKLKIYLADN